MRVSRTGKVDATLLIEQNTKKAVRNLHTLHLLGLSPSGFSRLLATRLYQQFLRSQLEYGLAIQRLTVKQIKLVEDAQSTCLRRIYGSRYERFSTVVMRHLANLPSMASGIAILQAKYLFRTNRLPEDALLPALLPRLLRMRNSRYRQLKTTPLWKRLPANPSTLEPKAFRCGILAFLAHQSDLARNGAVPFTACRPQLGVDPILWVPMTRTDRSRCLRWRLGWMPSGKD